MPQNERIRVAIVGSGIVGLTLAVALNAFDKEHKIAIDLYEAAAELSEIGAGINMWPRTWQIFQQIGLGDTLALLFDHLPDCEPRIIYEIRKADQKDGFKVMDIVQNGGVLRIHRADFQRSLIKYLPLPGSNVVTNATCNLHLSHRLVDYTYTSHSWSAKHPGAITLHFADKPCATCDILIGADGIKSTVRQLFLKRLPNPERYERSLEPVWSGAIAYRGLVAREDLEKVFPGHRALNHPGIMYFGKNKHTVVYSIAGGKFVNFVAAVHDKSRDGTVWEGPWNAEVTQGELFDKFSGWEEEFQALIHCIKKPTRWALQNLHPSDTFAQGRVFLIGDSAHAMVPFQAAGAGVGIEDAYILASLLTDPATPRSLSPEFVDKLANAYNLIRVPHGRAISEVSNKQGYLYVLDGPAFERYKEGDDIPKDLLLEPFRAAERNWSWAILDPEVERRMAVGLLQTPRARL